MELRSGVIWARVIGSLRTKIGTSVGFSPVYSSTQVASRLASGYTTSGEIEELAGCGRMGQVSMLIAEMVVGIWNEWDVRG